MQTTKTRVIRWAGAAVVAVTAGPLIAISQAHAADPATDSNCSTQPASVPDGWSCLLLDEPTGNDPSLQGETWFSRTDANHLLIRAFPTLSLDSGEPVQVCARDSAAYDPVANGQVDKCSGGNAGDRIYVGGDLILDLDLTGFVAPDKTMYFVIHINQGGKTTTSQGSGSAPETPVYSNPSATASATCDALVADVTSSDDPAGTMFTVTADGAATSHLVHGVQHFSYAGGANRTITVSVGETTLATASSPASCGAHDPTTPSVTFTDSCTSGVTVSLDNPTAAPVTFTVDSTSGRANKITVPAGGTQSVSYPVVEDTTATVTVLADGMSTATHSYAKNCVQVQGVKVTKPTTAVLGEKVTRAPAAPATPATPATLPFTGTRFPVGWALALGVLLLAFGSLLVAAPDRLATLTGGRHRA